MKTPLNAWPSPRQLGSHPSYSTPLRLNRAVAAVAIERAVVSSPVLPVARESSLSPCRITPWLYVQLAVLNEHPLTLSPSRTRLPLMSPVFLNQFHSSLA